MQNGIGNVGWFNRVISVTPVIQAALYATGDIVGGKITIPGALSRPGGTATLRSLALCCKSALAVDMDVVLFSDDPTNTTFTENGAAAIAVTDVEKILGVYTLSSRVVVGTPVVATLSGLMLPLQGNGTSRDLFAAMIVRGGPTFASTSDLIIRFGIQQDQ